MTDFHINPQIVGSNKIYKILVVTDGRTEGMYSLSVDQISPPYNFPPVNCESMQNISLTWVFLPFVNVVF